MNTINEINTIQAQSMDPSDMGAYNLTMYGINSITDIKSHIMNTVGDVNNYDIYNSTTMGAYQVDPTAVPTTLMSGVVSQSSGAFSSGTVTTNLMPVHDPVLLLVIIAFVIVLGKFIFLRR
ncbi:hypothetical protein CUJ83_03870 [Methanocella sp. CWC-04]|uniref:Uncharacterized protein n=1 Tax=Methanooceanicella nereidis TaxID=2052831 RepID=A0AAP2RDN8_9EURY|nr:hypothetical protein [Methanocella sp. CWC-04]MCD1294130.1 hypothetical protein [Methanocella sp. CWC-04]